MTITPIRPPIIVHHMAAMDGLLYPQNSLEAIRQCLDAKASFIEVDITALANSDYLLVHELDLESETTGQGRVADCPVDQARRLRIKGTDYGVALLSDVVSLMREYTGTRLQLDFKNTRPFLKDEPLHRLVQLIEPLGERVIVSTNADWQLRKLRQIAPWLDLGFDVHFYIDWRDSGDSIDPRVPPYRLGAYGYWDDHPLATTRLTSPAEYLADRCASMVGLVPRLSTFYVEHKLLAQSLDDGFNWAEALHEYGIKLDVWTLDVGNPRAETNARRLLAAGIDQFTTNTPKAMSILLTPGSS